MDSEMISFELILICEFTNHLVYNKPRWRQSEECRYCPPQYVPKIFKRNFIISNINPKGNVKFI